MCSLGLHFPEFEVYGERSQNPEQSGLDTYIRIQK
jgi:predicted transcriptional regulator YdeE